MCIDTSNLQARHAIDITAYGNGQAKTIAQLYQEVRHVLSSCTRAMLQQAVPDMDCRLKTVKRPLQWQVPA